MQPKLKQVIAGVTAFCVILFLVFVLRMTNTVKELQNTVSTLPTNSEVLPPGNFGVGNNTIQHASYNLVGTPTAPSTLTALFDSTSTTGRLARGLNNIVLAGKYTPKTTNANMYIKLERSLDGGTTYVPYSLLQETTTEILVFADDFATSTSVSAPFTIPGDKTSTSGTEIGFSFDMTIAADYLRVSLAEQNGTSTPGTANLQMLLNSN